MYMTTLTAFIAVLAIFAIILARPEVRAGARPGPGCQITRPRPGDSAAGSGVESLPRLSRNHWERQDIARMLMTEDDYTGRITPQPTRPESNGPA